MLSRRYNFIDFVCSSLLPCVLKIPGPGNCAYIMSLLTDLLKDILKIHLFDTKVPNNVVFYHFLKWMIFLEFWRNLRVLAMILGLCWDFQRLISKNDNFITKNQNFHFLLLQYVPNPASYFWTCSERDCVTTTKVKHFQSSWENATFGLTSTNVVRVLE